jgi:hypothetical protein
VRLLPLIAQLNPSRRQRLRIFEMTVFIVVCGNWQDYEGGGDEILAVHATREGAMETIRMALKDRGRDPNQKPRRDGQWFISGPPSSEWLEINKEQVLP